jgi:hypothetical protein
LPYFFVTNYARWTPVISVWITELFVKQKHWLPDIFFNTAHVSFLRAPLKKSTQPQSHQNFIY